MSDRKTNLLRRLGVHLIEIPNPYTSQMTNAYFIDGDVPTLVDTGGATPKAYEALASSLSALGRGIADIERIILTHGHADHRALAARVGKESGAVILLHPLEAGKTLRRSKRDPKERGAGINIFRSMGVPEEALPRLMEEPREPLIDPESATTCFVDDGDVIDCGSFSLKVLHTPGHSCGSICLHEEASGALFSGDTILSGSHVTAMLELDIVSAEPEYNSLKLHMESLRRLVNLGASFVLPGHGEILNEYSGVVDELLERHSKRRRHILRSLRNGPRTLYRICRSTFLFASTDELFLALSEVSGNIAILIDEGKVGRTLDSGVFYYHKI
jgi:glyoxylase-like metal-dependent hydrolase (beta-lactamase superfamily II)